METAHMHLSPHTAQSVSTLQMDYAPTPHANNVSVTVVDRLHCTVNTAWNRKHCTLCDIQRWTKLSPYRPHNGTSLYRTVRMQDTSLIRTLGPDASCPKSVRNREV